MFEPASRWHANGVRAAGTWIRFRFGGGGDFVKDFFYSQIPSSNVLQMYSVGVICFLDTQFDAMMKDRIRRETHLGKSSGLLIIHLASAQISRNNITVRTVVRTYDLSAKVWAEASHIESYLIVDLPLY